METRSYNKDIYTYTHWTGMKVPILMGVLKAEFTRGKEIFSFSYSDNWLKSAYSQVLDPELQLFPDRSMQKMRNRTSEFLLERFL